MTDKVDGIYQDFFDELENDTNFFDYFNHSDEEAMRLARERAYSYLISACRFMRRKCDLTFDLGLTSIITEQGEEEIVFVAPITPAEEEILTMAMLVTYYDRQVAKLLPSVNAISASELKLIHSPAAERDSYLRLLDMKKWELADAIADYSSRDRLTSTRLYVEYALPVEEEGEG